MKVMNPGLVRAARRFDFVWRLLSWSSRRAPKTAGEDIASILVIDLHLLGDMVMLTSLLTSLRQSYPSARISLLAGPWSAPVLKGLDCIDEVLPYVAPWVKRVPIRSAIVGYLQVALRLHSLHADIGIDVRGDIRQILLLFLAGCRRRIGFDFTGGGALLTDVVSDDGRLSHILDHHERIAARLGAWDGRPFLPRLSLTDEETQAAAAIEPFVGIHLGASLPLRRLPPAEAAALIEREVAKGERIVLFSAPDIDDYNIEVTGRLPDAVRRRLEIWRGDVRQFVVKVSRARRMFVMDSGPAHIAAALGCETIVFFGPNLPRYTGPRSPKVRFVEDTSVLCRPCDQRHCTHAIHQACMLGLVTREDRSA